MSEDFRFAPGNSFIDCNCTLLLILERGRDWSVELER